MEQDIQYAVRDGQPLLLDAYIPESPGPHPAVIVIPGGRWVNIDKAHTPGAPLAQAGFAAFAVNHRPANEAPYPAPVKDVQAAVRWVREHASEFDVDPDRLGAMGASSGGHLAGMLATLGEGPLDTGARVKVAVSWSGPMDLVLLGQKNVTMQRTVERFLACSFESCLELAQQASPITHLDPSDAPLFLANAVDEVIPFDQATVMEKALSREGVAHELLPIQRRAHAWSFAPEAFGPTVEFLGDHLGISPSGGAIGGGIDVPSGEGPRGAEADQGRPVARPRGEAAGSDESLVAILGGAAVILALTLALVVTWVLTTRGRIRIGRPDY